MPVKGWPAAPVPPLAHARSMTSGEVPEAAAFSLPLARPALPRPWPQDPDPVRGPAGNFGPPFRDQSYLCAPGSLPLQAP